MGTTATQMPPFSQAIVDPKTGLATPNMGLWQQELLRARQSWIVYTPTTTHLTAITVNDCAFQTLGKFVAFRVGLTGTTDGANAVTFTLPFKAKTANQAFLAVIDPTGAGGTLSPANMASGDFLTVTVTTVPGAGAHNFLVSGVYEAQ